jgi:hypothetical protein
VTITLGQVKKECEDKKKTSENINTGILQRTVLEDTNYNMLKTRKISAAMWRNCEKNSRCNATHLNQFGKQ